MNLPHVQPINPTRIAAPFDHSNFVFELKHDGFRAMAYIENGKCELVSRKSIVYKSFAGLASIMAKLPVKNVALAEWPGLARTHVIGTEKSVAAVS